MRTAAQKFGKWAVVLVGLVAFGAACFYGGFQTGSLRDAQLGFDHLLLIKHRIIADTSVTDPEMRLRSVERAVNTGLWYSLNRVIQKRHGNPLHVWIHSSDTPWESVLAKHPDGISLEEMDALVIPVLTAKQ